MLSLPSHICMLPLWLERTLDLPCIPVRGTSAGIRDYPVMMERPAVMAK